MSLALIMPAWMEYFQTLKPERYYGFARNVMKTDPHGKTQQQIIDDGIAAFRDFIDRSGLPIRLSQIGISESDLPEILADVRKISFNAHGRLSCNPPVTGLQLQAILQAAL